MKDSAFPPGHFYSPIPDTDALDPDGFEGCFAPPLVLDEEAQLTLLRRFAPYAAELALADARGQPEFDWTNTMYPPADAIAYYGMLRDLQPSRVVEIGAGYSSLVALRALEANGRGRLTCIDPYPAAVLAAQRAQAFELIPDRVERLPLDLFRSLAAGDVLFVDSSHQCKTQSDVNYIFFRLLPALPAGVHVHFHDIFLPDEYPWFWLAERGLFFNEQYLLLAFLQHNEAYEVVLANHYLASRREEDYLDIARDLYARHAAAFRRDFPGVPPKLKAGAFWLRKR